MTVDEAVSLAALIVSGHIISVRTETLVAFAKDGWQEAHDALCRRAQELTDQGEALPLDLQQYVVAAAKGFHSPAKGPGASPYRNFGRDLCIKVAIHHLLELGFTATRNEATEDESACSIVATAMRQIGIEMSEAAVAKVWEKAVREDRLDPYETITIIPSYDSQ
jgi:hypothetical protein